MNHWQENSSNILETGHKEKARQLIWPKSKRKLKSNYSEFVIIIYRKQIEAKKKLNKIQVDSSKKENIVDMDIGEDLLYRPKTKESSQHYEELLHYVQLQLSDYPQEAILNAADEVLAILKTEDINSI